MAAFLSGGAEGKATSLPFPGSSGHPHSLAQGRISPPSQPATSGSVTHAATVLFRSGPWPPHRAQPGIGTGLNVPLPHVPAHSPLPRVRTSRGAVALPVVASDSAIPLPGVCPTDSMSCPCPSAAITNHREPGVLRRQDVPSLCSGGRSLNRGAGSPRWPCGAGRVCPRPHPRLWLPDSHPHSPSHGHVCDQIPPFHTDTRILC